MLVCAISALYRVVHRRIDKDLRSSSAPVLRECVEQGQLRSYIRGIGRINLFRSNSMTRVIAHKQESTARQMPVHVAC